MTVADATFLMFLVLSVAGWVLLLLAPRPANPDEALSTFREGFGCALLTAGTVVGVIGGVIWLIHHVRVTP